MESLRTDDHIFIDTVDNSFKGKEKVGEAWKNFFKQFPDYQNIFKHLESRDSLVLDHRLLNIFRKATECPPLDRKIRVG